MAGFSPPFKPTPDPELTTAGFVAEEDVRAYREWLAAQPVVPKTLFSRAASLRGELLREDDEQARLGEERSQALKRMKAIEADLDALQDELVRHGYRMNDDGKLEAKS